MAEQIANAIIHYKKVYFNEPLNEEDVKIVEKKYKPEPKETIDSTIAKSNDAIKSTSVMTDDSGQVFYKVQLFASSKKKDLSKAEREVDLFKGMIGTSSIAHRRLPNINWLQCDNYGHDWTFVKKLIDTNLKHKKINGCEYNVCHIPTQVDC
jgi:hypothetical protein